VSPIADVEAGGPVQNQICGYRLAMAIDDETVGVRGEPTEVACIIV
jgi:hypothetical protein